MPISETEIKELTHRLFPIHRSQTGTGVRETLDVLGDFGIQLDRIEIPSGTRCFDWHIPMEWNINDAYIADMAGKRLVDYRQSNLHVVNGSVPIDQTMSFEELAPYLHTCGLPDALPYRTAFFQDTWGFCINQIQLEQLRRQKQLQVKIDASYFPGCLTYGEATLSGETHRTILIWTHICHPSLANDNVSGIATAAALYHRLHQLTRREYNYHFVFAPATIGAIAWISKNEDLLPGIFYGLVLSLLGDDSNFTFKKTRANNHFVDRCLENLKTIGHWPASIRLFEPMGYDERQFSSPGINVPTARITRNPEAGFPQYHTSADNLDFISENRILESVELVFELLMMAEDNCLPVNTSPKCEPRLGQRRLFSAFGDSESNIKFQKAVLWVLNLADGTHDALEISSRSGLPFQEILTAIHTLEMHGLIQIRKVNP